MRRALLSKANLNADRSSPGEGSVGPGCLPRAATTPDTLAAAAADPSAVAALVAGFPVVFKCAVAEVQALHHPGPEDGALVQLYQDGRKGLWPQ